MPYLSVDPCEVAVERSGVERGHSTEGTVDRGSNGFTRQGADPVPHQGADWGLNDAVDVLHYKPLKLKSSMFLHDTCTHVLSTHGTLKYIYISLYVLSWNTNYKIIYHIYRILNLVYQKKLYGTYFFKFSMFISCTITR